MHIWLRQYERDSGGLINDGRQRLKMEWEVRELRRSNDILRQASDYLQRRILATSKKYRTWWMPYLPNKGQPSMP